MSDFRHVINSILTLDELDSQGRGDSKQADTIRDSMDGSWGRLTEVERKITDAVSVQLFESRKEES